MFQHLSGLLKPAEEIRALPAVGIDGRVQPLRQGAGQVFRQAPAGDVGHAVQGSPGLAKPPDQLSVEGGGGE